MGTIDFADDSLAWRTATLNYAALNPNEHLAIAFWNVENLFDLEDDPQTNDEQYLPNGEYEWTNDKYFQKLRDLATIISELGVSGPPAVLGVCEVENRFVLEMLAAGIQDVAGTEWQYQVVHQDSRYNRGADVALLYNPTRFDSTQTSFEAFPVRPDPNDSSYYSRDVLGVTLYPMGANEPLGVYVNHWPSRRSEDPARIVAASVLKAALTEWQETHPESPVVIMGDLNDSPANVSVRETLGTQPDVSASHSLVELLYPYHAAGAGTHNYRGEWNLLDHLIVSGTALDETGLRVLQTSAEVYATWTLRQTEPAQYRGYPNRTYVGPRYLGGVSDHFPVRVAVAVAATER